MSRTNIDIDDELIAKVMKDYGLKTKREAVEFALRRVVKPPLDPDYLLSLEGTGWDGVHPFPADRPGWHWDNG